MRLSPVFTFKAGPHEALFRAFKAGPHEALSRAYFQSWAS